MLSQELLAYCRIEGLHPSTISPANSHEKTLLERFLPKVDAIKVSLKESGVQPTTLEIVYLLADQLICGETQLSAVEYLQAGGTYQDCLTLEKYGYRPHYFSFPNR